METVEQREQRIRRLEQGRRERHGGTVWPTPDDAGTGVVPIEVAPGRGDLSISSGFVPTFPTALYLAGFRAVSFARIFMSQPWVAAAVMRMLTWSVRVPLHCYRREGSEAAERTRLHPSDHPLAAAIVGIDRQSQAQLVQSLLAPVLVHGNSVTLVESGSGGQIKLSPKDWRYSQPIMPFRDALEGFAFDVDAPAYRQQVSIDEVLHCAWWSPIGPIGTSPLQQLGVTIQIEDAAQRHQRSLLAQGARPPSAITMDPSFLSQDPADRERITKQLREDLTRIYAGPENAGKPALLPPGLSWDSVGMTNVEAQLLDQRLVNREEIAGVYTIQPIMLGMMDKANYSNMAAAYEKTYTDSLAPPLILIEQAINAQVARDLLKESDLFVEFDFEAVLRGDRLQEVEMIREAVATAVLTPNEGRGIIGKARIEIPGMDQTYLPYNNLQPVGHPPVPNVPALPASGEQVKRLHVRSRDVDYEKVVA